MLEKDYSKYTFDDFLADDFFVSSIKNPDKKSLDFWNELIENNKLNTDIFYAAKGFLESIEDQNEPLADSDMSALWLKINQTNKQNTPKSSIKRLYISIGVAASIAVLGLAIPFLMKDKLQSGTDIISYVQKNKVSRDNLSETQLMLSDDNVIVFEDKDIDIVYDSVGIKASKQEISKQEISAFNQLLVPKGKRSRLTLADGTKLHINSGTRVVYPAEFSDKKREIYVDGEIFIEVSPDSKRPFIVKTSQMDIQVLGTKFNVMAYESDENKQVVLTSGAVSIIPKSHLGDIKLTPSQMYEYLNGRETVKNVDVSKYISWIDGLFYFESERLDNIMLRLSRYYGVDILYNKDIADLRCTGKMDLKENLEDVLNGLSFSFPIKIESENNKYKITMKSM